MPVRPSMPVRLPHRTTLLYYTAGYPTSSRVIYTAKGGHTNPADAHHPFPTPAAPRAAKATSARPPALNLPLPHPHEAPWLDSTGHSSYGGGAGGGARGRAYSANSAGAAAGLLSPRYLQSTTVSQAKAVEPSGRTRAEKPPSPHRHSSGSGARRGRGKASLGGGDGGGDGDVGGSGGAGAGGVGFGGPAGMLESLGGFLGIGKMAGGAVASPRWGKGRRQARNDVSFFVDTAVGWLFSPSLLMSMLLVVVVVDGIAG